MHTIEAPNGSTLKDGRRLAVSLAGVADVVRIAAEHPLPRESQLSRRGLLAYYAVKARLYVTAPGAGIAVGDVDGELAGFVCFSTDAGALSSQARRPGTAGWIAWQGLLGRLGGARELVSYARWAWQHFRSPEQLRSEARNEGPDRQEPEGTAEVGTVHTVPGYRRLGVARRLMATTEDRCRELGAGHVALWVASDNAGAIELYRRTGYEAIGELDRIGERCLRMLKPLD